MADSTSLLTALASLQDKPTKQERQGKAIQAFAGQAQPTSAFGAIAKGLAQGAGAGMQLKGADEREERMKGLQTQLEEQLQIARRTEAHAEQAKQIKLAGEIKEIHSKELDGYVTAIAGLEESRQASALESVLNKSSSARDFVAALTKKEVAAGKLSVTKEQGTNIFSIRDKTSGEEIIRGPLDSIASPEGKAKIAEILTAQNAEVRAQGKFDREDPQNKIDTFKTLSAQPGVSPELAASASGLGKIQTSGSSLTKSVEGRAKLAGLEQAEASLDTLEFLVFDEDGSLKQENLASSMFSFIPFLDDVTGTEGRALEAAGLSTVNSIFRMESGAAVPEPEVVRYMKMFIPTLGDSRPDAQFKVTNLRQRMRAMAEKVSGIDPTMSKEEQSAELMAIFKQEEADARKLLQVSETRRERINTFAEQAKKKGLSDEKIKSILRENLMPQDNGLDAELQALLDDIPVDASPEQGELDEELQFLLDSIPVEQEVDPSQPLEPGPEAINTDFVKRIPGNLATAGEAAIDAGVAFAEGVRETPIQTIAGLGTGIIGGGVGKMGPFGFWKRAMVDVPFQWAAKEAEELLGISAEDDAAIINLGEAMVEQLGAEAAMLFMKKTGFLKRLAPEEVDKLFKDVSSPKSVGQMKAGQVEKEVFGAEEIFTAQERSAGRAGGRQGAKLATEAQIAKEIFSGDPKRAKTVARNNRLQQEMRNMLVKADDNFDLEIKPAKVAETLKSSAETRLAVMGEASDQALNHSGRVADKLTKTRDFDAVGLEKVLIDNKAVIERAIGKSEYAAVLKKLGNARTITTKGKEKVKVTNKFTGGFSFKEVDTDVTEISDKITGKDTFEIVEGMLATFSDKQERGVFLNKIWQPITGVLEGARGTASNELADSYLRANNGYIATSHLKSSSAYQSMLNATEQSVGEIFRNPHIYEKVMGIDAAAGGVARQTMPRLLDSFAIESMINPATKEVDFNNVSSFMKKYGRENIRKVLGEDRAHQLDLIGSMSFFLEQNPKIKNLARSSVEGVSGVEALREGVQNVGGTQFQSVPRVSINGALAWASDIVRKKLNITDEKALMRAMKSQAAMQYTKENMSNPRSYPLYVNVMREIGLKPISRATYDEAVEDFMEDNKFFVNDPNAPLPSMDELLQVLDEEEARPALRIDLDGPQNEETLQNVE